MTFDQYAEKIQYVRLLRETGLTNYLSVLTLLLVVLKLFNLISWSWWWVLAPSLIPAAILGILLLVLLGWYAVIRWRVRQELKRL